VAHQSHAPFIGFVGINGRVNAESKQTLP
jgi:hypothetical protein